MVIVSGHKSILAFLPDSGRFLRFNNNGACETCVLTFPPIANSKSNDDDDDNDNDEISENFTSKQANSDQTKLKEKLERDQLTSESRQVVAAALSPSEDFLVICDNLKHLIVYKTGSWTILGYFKVDRKCDHIIFNENEDKLIVSHRSGWIYGYDLNSFNSSEETRNPADFLLGHNSIILDAKLSPGSKYLATCDRDEKIRVSNYPNCYNIESYCLGHTQFVSALTFIDDQILVSGSGDGTLRVWRCSEGEELSVHDFKKDFESDQRGDKIAPMAIHTMLIGGLGTIVIVTYYNSSSFIIYLFNKDTKSLVNLVKTKLEADIIYSFICDGHIFCFTDSSALTSIWKPEFYQGDLHLVEVNLLLKENLARENRFMEDFINNKRSACNIGWLYKHSYNNLSDYMERKKERQDMKVTKKLRAT